MTVVWFWLVGFGFLLKKGGNYFRSADVPPPKKGDNLRSLVSEDSQQLELPSEEIHIPITIFCSLMVAINLACLKDSHEHRWLGNCLLLGCFLHIVLVQHEKPSNGTEVLGYLHALLFGCKGWFILNS